MALIFALSTDIGSAAHTSRFVEPLLHWLVPGISQKSVDEVHFLIRKAAHLSAYAVLAVLCYRAVASRRQQALQSWSWTTAAIGLLLSACYAASDEFHQSFVPSRGACVRDVMIDICGALIGLSVICAFRWRSRHPSP
jgi:VanZ family protein